MTGHERLAVAVALSVALHWVLLEGLAPPASSDASGSVLVVNLSPPEMGLSVAAPVVVAQAAEPEPDSGGDDADRRRQAMNRYLEAVLGEIHARRQATAARSEEFVGNALFSVRIDRDGAFSRVRMIRSSGDAALDEDAAHAIARASGVVERPGCLGRRALDVRLAVKYQFGL